MNSNSGNGILDHKDGIGTDQSGTLNNNTMVGIFSIPTLTDSIEQAWGLDYFTSSQKEILHYVLVATACLTLLGTSSVILTFLFKHRHEKGSLVNKAEEDGAKMIFLINLPGFFGSFFWFPWFSQSNQVYCVIQASGIQFFEVSSLIWSSCIVITFLQVVSKRNSKTGVHRNPFLLFHLFGWGVPLLSVIPALYFKLFGETPGVWCWISNPRYRMFLYGPGLLVVIFIVGSYLYLRIKLSKQEGYEFITGRFFYFILASFICQAPSFVNRIQNFIDPSNPIFALYFMQTLLQPLQGFINAITYGIIDEYFWGRFCCTGRDKTNKNNKGVKTSINSAEARHLLVDYDDYGSQKYYINPYV